MFDSLKYIDVSKIDNHLQNFKISKKLIKEMEEDGYDIRRHLSTMPWATKENYTDKIPEYKYISVNGATNLDKANIGLFNIGFDAVAECYHYTDESYNYKDKDFVSDTYIPAFIFETSAHFAMKKLINQGVRYMIPFMRKTFQTAVTPEKLKEYNDYCDKYFDTKKAFDDFSKKDMV